MIFQEQRHNLKFCLKIFTKSGVDIKVLGSCNVYETYNSKQTEHL